MSSSDESVSWKQPLPTESRVQETRAGNAGLRSVCKHRWKIFARIFSEQRTKAWSRIDSPRYSWSCTSLNCWADVGGWRHDQAGVNVVSESASTFPWTALSCWERWFWRPNQIFNTAHSGRSYPRFRSSDLSWNVPQQNSKNQPWLQIQHQNIPWNRCLDWQEWSMRCR